MRDTSNYLSDKHDSELYTTHWYQLIIIIIIIRDNYKALNGLGFDWPQGQLWMSTDDYGLLCCVLILVDSWN